MKRRPSIDQLIVPLRTVRRRRLLQILVSPYARNTLCLTLSMAAIIGFAGHSVPGAIGMALAGVWMVVDHARTRRTEPIHVPAIWFANAIEADLTAKGRGELTELLLRPSVTLEQATAWAEAERHRQREMPDAVPARIVNPVV